MALSELEEAVLLFPATSVTRLAGSDAVTRPLLVIPLTATSQVVSLFGAISVRVADNVPVPVLLKLISAPVKVVGLMGSLKVTV
jgi:hypothetical protein